jgi:hypothetical protein
MFDAYIVIFLFLSLELILTNCKSGKGERKLSREKLPALTPVPDGAEFEKNPTARQTNSPEARIIDSSSRNAVNFSSARKTKRFPSQRCASVIQIVRPLESIAETQPQLTDRSVACDSFLPHVAKQAK